MPCVNVFSAWLTGHSIALFSLAMMARFVSAILQGARIIPRIPFALMPKSKMDKRGEDVLLK